MDMHGVSGVEVGVGGKFGKIGLERDGNVPVEITLGVCLVAGDGTWAMDGPTCCGRLRGLVDV